MEAIRNLLLKGLLTGALLGSALAPADAQLIYTTIKSLPSGSVLNNPDSTQGIQPAGRLTEGKDGALYGTLAHGGGTNSNIFPYVTLGTVCRLNKDGTGFVVLWRFVGAPMDGATPLAGLVEGSDGSLYGTTSVGG